MENQHQVDSSFSASFSKDQLSQSNESGDELFQEPKSNKKKEDQSPHHSSISDDDDSCWSQDRKKVKLSSYRLPQQFQVVINEQEVDQVVGNSEKYTEPTLTKFERTSILGARASQIQNNSAIYVEIPEQERNGLSPLEIAERELKEKKIPFKIRRYLPNNGYEEWNLQQFVFD